MIFVTGDTMVLMANGSERKIDGLQFGDMVYTDHGPMRVQDVMTGYEAEIAEIVFADGKVLQIATDQNLLTDRGYCSVRELCNAKHAMVGNNRREVKSITIKQFGGTVYGIMLDQDAELIYNSVRLNNQGGY